MSVRTVKIQVILVGKPCHCFKQQAIDLIYTQSNIKDILTKENFSTLSLDYYSDSNVNPATGLTSLATAKAAVARCHEFVDQFDNTFANLYFLEIPESERHFSQTALQKNY